MTNLETQLTPFTGLTEESIPHPTDMNQQNPTTNEDGKVKVELNTDHIAIIKQQYKKVKRYMRSSIYQIRVMDGTEKVVNELLDKYYQEEP
jgi:hypothetical protein